MASFKKDEEDIENNSNIETQFILRLPVETSRILKALMHAGVSLKDRLSLDFENDMRHAVFQLDNWIYWGKIYDLPTIIESYKTIDRKSLFKTADLSQICICKTDEFTSSEEETTNDLQKEIRKREKHVWPHGVTPPLKNVRKHRFRKTLRKEFVELSEIEREVKTLLRADNEALSVKWEIVYEDESQEIKNTQEEYNLFGADITDDEEDTIIMNNSKNIDNSSSDEKK